MAHPLTLDALKELAAKYGVCVRPVAMRRTDLATGQTEVFDIACGATRESRCAACARRGKRDREHQCREGWHRSDEPLPAPQATEEQVALLRLRAHYEYARADCMAIAQWQHIAELDDAIAEVDQMITASRLRGRVTAPHRDKTATVAASIAAGGDISQALAEASTCADSTDRSGPGSGVRRVRSTRRRQDAPHLPRQKVAARTVGRTFDGRGGKVFHPSTFVTLTLPSYGRVGLDGASVNPDGYDYRGAAWDAVHFPALLDRLWQNLRRAVGWNVQYFGTVEPQRRLAPHAHFAVRGAIPRAVIRQVIKATYQQVWWPSTAVIRYPEYVPQPVWDDDMDGYVDPSTGEPLATWAQAIDALDDDLDTDPNRGPEHVVRFGEQMHLQGVLAGTAEAERCVRYLSKYMVKSVAECRQPTTVAAVDHQHRLWQELRVTPCSSRCANWLRYGIQPERPKAKMTAGYCRAKVHQLDTLGIGGRRVLVSRLWTGKTLADHRHDQTLWVRQLLAVARGIEDDIDDETAAQIAAARAGGSPAPIAWEKAKPGDPDVPDLARRLLRGIATRIKHRAIIAAAKGAAPPGIVSATG